MKDTPRVRKVLMTADGVGGVWSYALDLTRALGRFDIEVRLAVMGKPLNRQQHAAARAVPNLAVVEGDYRLEWMDDPWDDVERAGRWLLALGKRFEPDVVHLNGYAHGHLPWSRPKIVVAHSCVLSWWRAVRREAPPETCERYRIAVRRGLRAADVIVAPTAWMLATVENQYGRARESRVIPNGCDPADFHVGAKEPLVLTAGRLWDEAKNVAAVERVAPRLGWRVCVAGETAAPQPRPASPTGPGAGPAVTRLGFLSRDELRSWYARSSIYALPAHYEPFGLTPLEAALSGNALVLGNIPTLKEVWGPAAVYVPPDDDDALERALRFLIENDGERRAMAERARNRALLYGADRMARSYADLYGEVVERRVPSGRSAARPRPGGAVRPELHVSPIVRGTGGVPT